MNYEIKKLSQNSKIFFPLTSAEAVIVKDGDEIIRLDQALNKKVETITTLPGSGLTSAKSGKSVIITHANSITPNENPQNLKIKYDNRGHIIETAEISKITILVNDLSLALYNGNDDSYVNFSDSFKIDQNKIEINWNNISNGTT